MADSIEAAEFIYIIAALMPLPRPINPDQWEHPVFTPDHSRG